MVSSRNVYRRRYRSRWYKEKKQLGSVLMHESGVGLLSPLLVSFRNLMVKLDFQNQINITETRNSSRNNLI